TQSLNDVDVLQGYFSVQLDFGNVFSGDARFLEIGVRLGDSRENYTKLSPRRRITPSPYTIHADHISGLSAPDGSLKNAVVVDNNGKLNVKNGLLIEGKKPVLIRRFLAYGNNVLDSCEMNIFQI
ncbi:hypothetical protein KFU94_39350, partial [Chloroflexi bacterium TSY]|nr:hypothetical protein [Chloroflexi bacterium TSY]